MHLSHLSSPPPLIFLSPQLLNCISWWVDITDTGGSLTELWTMVYCFWKKIAFEVCKGFELLGTAFEKEKLLANFWGHPFQYRNIPLSSEKLVSVDILSSISWKYELCSFYFLKVVVEEWYRKGRVCALCSFIFFASGDFPFGFPPPIS